MKALSRGIVFFAPFVLAGHLLASTDCSSVPPPNPNLDFVQNFLSPCYEIPFTTAYTTDGLGADTNATYSRAFYRTNPKYEIIIIGTYPYARYLSITPYDDHLAIVKSLYDAEIVPLQPGYKNPYLPGAQYVAGQYYATTIGLGGTEPASSNILPGCSISNYNIHGNMFDGTKRHPGLSWNGAPNLPFGFPAHDDVGPSLGGQISVREYIKADGTDNSTLTVPVMLVRDLTTGCAVPAAQAFAVNGKPVTSDMIIAPDTTIGGQWLAQKQVYSHVQYSKTIEPHYCYSPDASNGVNFFGDLDYNPAANPDSGYAAGPVPPNPLNLTKFMRIRTKIPVAASIPCSGCSLSGGEQMRYWSLSFSGNKGKTLVSVDDAQVTKDPNGYATIIVGFGSKPPSYVTAANGYTFVDFSSIFPGYSGLQQLSLRNILTNPNFHCSAGNVPLFTTEYNPDGGFMGEYVPTVDLLNGNQIPAAASPYVRQDSCTLVPPPPNVCSGKGLLP